MSTQQQIETNRQNALASTGPKTLQGRKRSSRNSLKHGLSASTVLLPDEDQREFSRLERLLRQELGPEGILQETLFQRILACLWRLQRLAKIEASILTYNTHLEQQRRTLAHGYACHEDAKAPRTTGALVDEDKLWETIQREVKARLDMNTDETLIGQAYALDVQRGNALAQLRRHEVTLERSLYRAIYAFDALKHNRRSSPTNIPSLVLQSKASN